MRKALRLSAAVPALGVALALAVMGCVSAPPAPTPEDGRATVLSACMRPEKPDGLSGITRLADGRYAAIDDTGGGLYTLEIAADGSGVLTGCTIVGKVVLEGVTDGEGVAYDPLRGTVWATDESRGTLAEYSLSDGGRRSVVKMPEVFSKWRENRGLESLAISPDGRTLWTANEEALPGDGPVSTMAHGTTVRLQRFTRASAGDAWRPAGSFAYVTDAIGGTPYRGLECCGVSDLVVLGDGSLVVLERELSVKGFLPSFRVGLYRVDLLGATDVSALPALAGGRYRPVAKAPLLVHGTFISMYEGLAPGPRLADGSDTLLLVSDGDGPADEQLLLVNVPR